MEHKLTLHLLAGGLLTIIASVIALFWAFPKLLIFMLLAMVAMLAYGALYFILSAILVPQPGGDDSATPPPVVRRKKTAKKSAKKKRTLTKKSP